MDWGGNDIEVAQWVLSCPPEQAAKKVLIEDIKAKYGTLDELNASWGTVRRTSSSQVAGESLFRRRPAPDAPTERGHVDHVLIGRVEGHAPGVGERQAVHGLPGGPADLA